MILLRSTGLYYYHLVLAVNVWLGKQRRISLLDVGEITGSDTLLRTDPSLMMLKYDVSGICSTVITVLLQGSIYDEC